MRVEVIAVPLAILACAGPPARQNEGAMADPRPSSPPPAEPVPRPAVSPAPVAPAPSTAPPASAPPAPQPVAEAQWSGAPADLTARERDELRELVLAFGANQETLTRRIHPRAGLRFLYATLAELDGAQGNAEGHLLESRLVCAGARDRAIDSLMGYARDILGSDADHHERRGSVESGGVECEGDRCCISSRQSSFSLCYGFGWIGREPWLREVRLLLTRSLRVPGEGTVRVSPAAVEQWRRWMDEQSTVLASQQCPTP